MNAVLKKSLKIFGILLFSFILVIILYITVLAYPYPLFDHKHTIENITYYSDVPFNTDLIQTVEKTNQNISDIENFKKDHRTDVFLCRNQSLYNFFAHLTFVKTNIPGYNLSIVHNSFLSIPRISEINSNSYGEPKYSVFSGDLAHCIAHEVVHEFTSLEMGLFDYRTEPRWKLEGYAEYMASHINAMSDSTETLQDRISNILNKTYWTAHVVEYYSWRTTTEYLFTIKHLTFEQFMDNSITFESSYKEMLEWNQSVNKALI